jgi:hypothetical protein
VSQERNYHEVVMICLLTRNLLEQFCKWSSQSTETDTLKSTVVHGLVSASFVSLLNQCGERKLAKDVFTTENKVLVFFN